MERPVNRKLLQHEMFVSFYDHGLQRWFIEHAKTGYTDSHRSRRELFSRALDWLLLKKNKPGRPGRPLANRQTLHFSISRNAREYLKVLAATMDIDNSTLVNLLILRAHAELQQSIQEQQKCSRRV